MTATLTQRGLGAALVGLGALPSARAALPVLVTRFSRETLAQHQEERAAAARLRQRQLALAGPDLPVLDATAVLDDPARPGVYWLDLSNDHIHANDAGHDAVAGLLTPLLRHVLAQAG